MASFTNKDNCNILGRQHRVVELLGEGSFGQVVKCCNLETGVTEAVKVMKSCTDVIKIAKHEFQVLRQLRRLDPETCHVVKFYSLFFNCLSCLSFEVLDMDLNSYISERTPCKTGLPLPEVRDVLEQLVTALYHLKSIRLVHMDIKPENVMVVDRQEKPLKVKLVDFGGAQMSGNIDFNTMMFTRIYSSPEVLLESEMNEALDMWSLGVTAFKVAVGTDLFPYCRRYSIIDSIVKMLGQPLAHVLDKGHQTEEFFSRTNDNSRWTLKTAEEYGITVKEKGFSCFTDVEGILSVQQEDAAGLDLFLDLLKHMLQVDPNRRIKPMEALHHPFFHIKEEATPEERCVENLQLTSAVDQLEIAELVSAETFISENPAEVQPDQLTDGFQREDTLNYTCFIDTLRTVGHAVAPPKKRDLFHWFDFF